MGAFVAKNSDATSWHELLNLFGPFCIEFCKATKQSRTHPNSTNAPNVSLGSHGVERVSSLRKNPTRLRGTNFCTATKWSRMHPNSTKRIKTSVLGPMGWIGCFSCEKFRRHFVARNFALVRPVLHRVSTKWSRCNQIVRKTPKTSV